MTSGKTYSEIDSFGNVRPSWRLAQILLRLWRGFWETGHFYFARTLLPLN
jgi:hypothetical protein